MDPGGANLDAFLAFSPFGFLIEVIASMCEQLCSDIIGSFLSRGFFELFRYSAATCAPFSATERFIRSTRKVSAAARTPKARKLSK